MSDANPEVGFPPRVFFLDEFWAVPFFPEPGYFDSPYWEGWNVDVKISSWGHFFSQQNGHDGSDQRSSLNKIILLTI